MVNHGIKVGPGGNEERLMGGEKVEMLVRSQIGQRKRGKPETGKEQRLRPGREMPEFGISVMEPLLMVKRGSGWGGWVRSLET